MFDIQTVKSADDIREVAMLAHEIWNQYFVSIIGQEQVDYMLNEFQSPSAIIGQIASGYEYFLVTSSQNETPEKSGYLGLVPDEKDKRLMISKIYIREQHRGAGLGNYMLDFVKKLANDRGLTTIWLTVNRFNDDTIDWYKRKGFIIVDEVKKDIGGGFVMDDYLMELTVD
jgi:ribosomal protein S18 acetylase RimI-like enzyme